MRLSHRAAALGLALGTACREPRTLDPDTCVSVTDYSERLPAPVPGIVYPDRFRHSATAAVMTDIAQRIGAATMEFELCDCNTADFPAPGTVGPLGVVNRGKAIAISLRPHGSYYSTDGIAADSEITVRVLEHPRDCSVDNEFRWSDYTPPVSYAVEVEDLFRDAVHCATH